MESNKEDSSREHQDPINKRDNTNSTKTKVMRHDDHVGSSPLKKEITSQAASNSIKEATDLKHIADRLKVWAYFIAKCCSGSFSPLA